MARNKLSPGERRLKNLENARRHYNERKKTGLCIYCPEKALPGRIRCRMHKEIVSDYCAGRRDIWELKGLCTRCGKSPATRGKRCQNCAVHESEQRRRLNKKRKQEVSENA